MIRNTWIIARRDLKSYFASPLAYTLITAFLVIMGWMFFQNLSYFNQENLKYEMGTGRGTSITDGIIRPLFGNMDLVLLFITPFITMRLFSEEKKQHTLELLLTSPVQLSEIIFGKFLSSLILVGVMLSLTAVYPIILFATGNPELGPILTSYAGMLLLTSCYLSVGLLYSALTENQIIAGVLTFVTCLFFWLISWASHSTGPVLSEILGYFSIIGHFYNFGQGVINTSDVIFYLSFIGAGLFLTHRVLDSYRWR